MAKLHFRSYTTNQMVLFPQRIDDNIAENDPVRIVSSIVDHLDMSSVNKLYNGMGRCPVILYYIEDFSVKEIAQILEISEGAVQKRLAPFLCLGILKTLVSPHTTL